MERGWRPSGLTQHLSLPGRGKMALVLVASILMIIGVAGTGGKRSILVNPFCANYDPAGFLIYSSGAFQEGTREGLEMEQDPTGRCHVARGDNFTTDTPRMAEDGRRLQAR